MQKGKNSIIRTVKFNDLSAGCFREIEVQLNNRGCIIDFDTRVGLLFDYFQGRNWSIETEKQITDYLEDYFAPEVSDD